MKMQEILKARPEIFHEKTTLEANGTTFVANNWPDGPETNELRVMVGSYLSTLPIGYSVTTEWHGQIVTCTRV